MRDEEGGENQNDYVRMIIYKERKRLCTNELEKNELEEVVIYTKEIKEKKE